MTRNTIYKTLVASKPGIIALFDPDRMSIEKGKETAKFASDAGVAAILVGTSLMATPNFDEFVGAVRTGAKCPVILFPGGSQQISKKADAIFFLSLLSGRNPEFLIGEQVKAVFMVKAYGLEVIPVGYILVASGTCTAVEYMSNTKPIPRDKPEICVAHALAGEYLGSRFIYLEAGSGARQPIPGETIKKVKANISVPLIVGGGIRDPRDAEKAFAAGADFIVLGSIIEKSPSGFKKIAVHLRRQVK